MDDNEIDAAIGGLAPPAGGGALVPVTTTIVTSDAGQREYTLIVPPTVNGKRLRKIRMRLPLQGDIDDWGNGEIASLREFQARLTGLDPLVLRALAWPDAEAVHLLFRDIVPDFVLAGKAP